MAKLDPPLDLTPPPVDGGATLWAGLMLLTAIGAGLIDVTLFFVAVLDEAFRGPFTGRLPVLLATVGLLATSIAALRQGVLGGSRGRSLGYVCAGCAVPLLGLGLLSLYVVLPAY